MRDDEAEPPAAGAARNALPPACDTSGDLYGQLTELGQVDPDGVGGRLLGADRHDFAGLYVRHRTSFTLHARRYLRDERDADEVVQEAFLRLFLALPELETELQALSYCRRTIANLCIDRYRPQARRRHLVRLDAVPLEELPDEDFSDPVVRAEDAALVREALSLLSPMHRAALVKREIEEKRLPVIAEELEIPEESVKHLLCRARKALRRLLTGTSLEPSHDGEGASALAKTVGTAVTQAVGAVADAGDGTTAGESTAAGARTGEGARAGGGAGEGTATAKGLVRRAEVPGARR